MPTLVPTSGLQLQEVGDSLLQRQMDLMTQLKMIEKKEKWRLAMMFREFHSRNGMRKIYKIGKRPNCNEVNLNHPMMRT